MTTGQIIKIFFCILICPSFYGQDISNPDLISKLKVKSVREIRVRPLTSDTTITKYDIKGRKIYRKSQPGCMQGIDSIFYVKSEEIRKNYSDELQLKLIDKKKTSDNGNTIVYDFIQYLSPSETFHRNTTLKYKNGTLIYRKQFENGKLKDLFDINAISKKNSADKQENKSIQADTTFDYLDDNEQYLELKQEGKLISYITFDNKGQIIATTNYVHNKPNEVSIFTRKYDTNTKTFTEIISKQLYYDNGLIKEWQDTESAAKTTFVYEFY